MSLKYTLVDIVPNSDSSETDQNSEPSIAVNPLNPIQMIAGAFSNGDNAPYYISTNGGAQWADYGTTPNEDKSIAWLTDGSAALTAWLSPDGEFIVISSGTTADSSFTPISFFPFSLKGADLDQPWIVIGPSNQVYVGYNDLSAANYTASV